MAKKKGSSKSQQQEVEEIHEENAIGGQPAGAIVDQEAVSEVLDQVEESLGQEPVMSSSGQSVEAKKNYEQHPKFHKFKGAKK